MSGPRLPKKPDPNDYPPWWRRAARLRQKILCQHLHADGIYGDEINAVGGKRGYCWSCRTYLDEVPFSFNETGDKKLGLLH